MTNYLRTGRLVGLLFLLMIVLGSTGLSFRGLSSSLIESETFLQDVLSQYSGMKLAVMLDLLSGILGISAAVILYPLLERHNRFIALFYLAAWIANYVTSLIGDINHLSFLSLLSLSQDYASASAAGAEGFNPLGAVLVRNYFWAHFFGLLLYSSGSFILFTAFWKYRLVPRLLSGWGMLAMISVFSATVAQLLDQEVNMWFYGQNGFHFIALTGWLLIKGFRQPDEGVTA